MKFARNLFSLILLILFCSCTEDSFSPDNIKTDQNKIDAAFTSARNNGKIRSLIVTRANSYYKEEYFTSDGATDARDVMSVTKSITSLLIGIAIDKGYITSADETIDKYIRPLIPGLDSAKGKITIRNLLTMSSGFEWYQMPVGNDFSGMMGSSDKLSYILNKALVSKPGEKFNYSDGTVHLLSVVLSRAVNMSAKEFAQLYLFAPLGISERTWLSDNRGYNYGGVRLFLLPQDMLKIGQLALNKGRWGNDQIVSEKWIRESSAFHISTDNIIPYGSSYGYYWWRGNSEEYNFFYANGYGGQFILIEPSFGVVIVATTDYTGLSKTEAEQAWYETMNIIIREALTGFYY